MQNTHLQIGPKSHVLQFASISFDAAVTEIFIPLCIGAQLYLALREALMPGLHMLALIKKHGITHIKMPPSVLAALPDNDLPSLETVMVAGEPCSRELYLHWGRGRQFFNIYGPTEATVCTTIALYSGGETLQSIGRPIANTQVYILDSLQKVQPVGVSGELYIGGMGVARGYLARPGLTAERFIPDPFSGTPGVRLYRTGDRVRYLPDGNIEFIGRLDLQVKFHGFRIELGEIERTISAYPEVDDCVVILAQLQNGAEGLIAFTRSTTMIPTLVLRRYLKEKLPMYMIPQMIIQLESFPLTPNRKIDRKALIGQLKEEYTHRTAQPVQPNNRIEEVILAIWKDLLGVEIISAEDSFIDLGGYSLLAIQAIDALETSLEIRPPVREMFRNGFRQFASLCERLVEQREEERIRSEAGDNN